MTMKELKEEFGQERLRSFKIQKYEGDDRGSWAVIFKGKAVVTGCLKQEAFYHLRHILKEGLLR